MFVVDVGSDSVTKILKTVTIALLGIAGKGDLEIELSLLSDIMHFLGIFVHFLDKHLFSGERRSNVCC